MEYLIEKILIKDSILWFVKVIYLSKIIKNRNPRMFLGVKKINVTKKILCDRKNFKNQIYNFQYQNRFIFIQKMKLKFAN